MKKQSRLKAITLIELLIAVSLLAMIGVTAATVELSMRKLNITTDTKTLLMNDLIYVKERLKKEIMFATGNATGDLRPFVIPPTQCSGDVRLEIRNDTVSDGVFLPGVDTASLFYWFGGTTSPCGVRPAAVTDQWGMYFFPDNSTASTTNNPEYVAANITDFEPGVSGVDFRRVTVEIENMKKPLTSGEDKVSNPRVRLRFGLTARQCPPFS